MLDRDTNEVKLYFKEHDYCVRTELTFNTYRMYCEFNNIPMVLDRELITVNLNTSPWNDTLEELVAF